MTDRIVPETLRFYRDRKGLTQEQLAQQCRCTKDTVSRWERGKSKRVRGHLRDQLLRALGVDDWKNLTKEPPQSDAADEPRETVQLNVRVRRETRNALTLVCHRYGLKLGEVIDYAPLLFIIAAEQSLIESRKALSEIEARIDENESMNGRAAPHLAPAFDFRHREVEEAIELENLRIQLRQINNRGEAYDTEEFDPFVCYLKRLASDLPEGSVALIEPNYSSAPNYKIADDTLDELLGVRTAPGSLVDQFEPVDESVREAVQEGYIDLPAAMKRKKEMDSDEFQTWLAREAAAGIERAKSEARDLLKWFD